MFANGVKIGSVPGGGIKTLKFTPKKDGNNIIFAESIPVIGPNLKSNIIHIYATPGAVIYARSELDRWGMKLLGDLILTADIEKEGAAVGSVNASISSDKQSNSQPIPWDAIGTIAGIFGTIAGFLALRR